VVSGYSDTVLSDECDHLKSLYLKLSVIINYKFYRLKYEKIVNHSM